MNFYKINNVICTLKPHGELTLEESEKIKDIFAGFGSDKDTIYTKFSNKPLVEFLSIVLTARKRRAGLL
jgi:hypothetical protein